MGEARRKARHQAGRAWAKGAIKVVANGVECFDWNGTREDAVDLQKRYLAAVNGLGLDARSYAKRAAGYLMVFGAPKAGEPRLMPNGFGAPWESVDVEMNRNAVLWLALREHIPNTGNRLEDVFVGKSLVVMFTGDREALLEETEREQRGQKFTNEQFQMMVAVLNERYLLNPDDAVGVLEADLYRLARGHCPDGFGEDTIHVPRIPRDATEANAMMETFTLLSDATKPSADSKLYAGYTEAELLRGGVGVSVR